MRKLVVLAGVALLSGAAGAAEMIKVGMIGLDTSHCLEFTKMLNAENPLPEYAGFRVAAVYPRGSRDIASSTNRVPGYLEKIKPLGVEVVDSIDAVLQKSDVILLESNDGRVHLEQALPVFKSGKRVFIDKPVAGSLAQVVAIFEAAKRYRAPMFSCSSLRYTVKTQEIRSGKFGPVLGAESFSPCSLEPTHPDFFWYGMHGVELLYTLMGTGCETVVRVTTPGTDVAVGTWQGGRVGSFRGNRASSSGYGADVFFAKGKQTVDDYKGYAPMLVEILKFFKTGVVPVTPEETIELFAFMEAADESKRRGGAPVKVADVLAKARAEAAKISLD